MIYSQAVPSSKIMILKFIKNVFSKLKGMAHYI